MWIDSQVSKAVLGQTMTTDNGSSKAQASVHNDVRLDILEADANELQNTINAQLVRPVIDLNFGVQKCYPKVVIRVPREENIELLVNALKELVPLGLPVDAHGMLEKLGLPVPDKNAVLLGPKGHAEEVEVNTVELNSAGSYSDDWVEVGNDVYDEVERIASECNSLEELQKKLQSVEGVEAGRAERLALDLLKARV